MSMIKSLKCVVKFILILHICGLPLTVSGQFSECGHCPDGWVRYKDSCYYFTHGSNRSFVDSEHFCKQHHARLVHVNDASENGFIKDYLSKILPANYWMGLTDELIEGEYKWTDTETVPEFTDWSAGQPDDYHHTEDCVIFWKTHEFLWDDTGCNAKVEAICELSQEELDSLVVLG